LGHEGENRLLRNVHTYPLTFTAVIYEGRIMNVVKWIYRPRLESSSCGKGT